MAVLGIEGTAHTLGVGIVREDPRRPGRAEVLANERRMVRPLEGGIHPREAAHEHAQHGPAVLQAALDAAGLAPSDLDAVAFSQGPGLGPCLRVAATMARALALRTARPLVGVNHCVAHLEIGRATTDARDPVLLYASGANTQVIAYARGRYRVFGETLDIGLGNALDKFARDNGIAFPGGPEVERLAAQADPGRPLLELPYSVKGMDLSFSGLATRAQALAAAGADLGDVCRAIQEHAFAALVEVSERALAHTGKRELLLGGGVACNARLQAMARLMGEQRGAAVHCPDRSLLVDNGAMIAWLGLRKARAGDVLDVAGSAVRPEERTDHVDVTWEAPAPTPPGPGTPSPPADPAPTLRGAEADVGPGEFLGRRVMAKRRTPRGYRHPALDARLRSARTREEATLLAAAREAGVPVPVLYDVDRGAATLLLERVEGPMLRSRLAGCGDAEALRLAGELGAAAARLHKAGIAHGDLTTSNVLATARGLVLIDFGLGGAGSDPEPLAVDLHLVAEALEATDARAPALWQAFIGAYRTAGGPPAALARLDAVVQRGRYR